MPARVGFTSILEETHTHTETRLVPEHKTFSGLKKYAVEAEKKHLNFGLFILEQCIQTRKYSGTIQTINFKWPNTEETFADSPTIISRTFLVRMFSKF